MFHIIACANKTQNITQDIKTQIKENKPSISFAKTQAQSNKWYKEYFAGNVKKLLKKQEALEYEQFAKIYFADLSQIRLDNKLIATNKLLQSVSFTYFAIELLNEYAFVLSQDSNIAPWFEFKSKLDLHDNVVSASFVAQIAEQIGQFENESYENFNDIALVNNLLIITNKYSKQNNISKETQDITGLDSYNIPQSLQDFLYYKILYMKYFEKFQSNYLLNKMAIEFPKSMVNATNKILKTNFKHNNLLQMQNHFKLTNFEPTNPLAIQQCKAGSISYVDKNLCITNIFLPWIEYLQSTLKQRNSYDFFPIYTDHKLCLLVWHDKTMMYPNNKDGFCDILYIELNKKYKNNKIQKNKIHKY